MPPIVLPRHRLLCAVLAAALLAGACATVENPVTGRAERTVLDEKAEIAEGAKQHRQVLADYGAVQDAKLQAYVGDIGRRLAQHSHRPGLEWHFTVLDSDEVNAFALPGGYVYVTRGIMAYMESEADLAGVMGHEIGHVTARHGAQRETRAQVAGLGVLAATILGAAIGVGDLASELSQDVAAGYVAHYSREQESQADRLGAEYLARAGYDPHNMVDVIQVLKDQERFAADLARSEGRQPDEGAGWLASHPSSDQRLADMRAVATQYSGQPGHYGDDRRARYLAAVDGLVFGEGREQGVTRGRNFYHEPLGIALTAPAGWKIRNTPEAIVLAAGDASAGLVVRTVPPQAGATPQEVIRNVVKPDAGRVEPRSLNGLAATHFVGTRRDAQGRAQNVELTVATGPGQRHFLFVYAARNEQALQAARPQLQEAEASFRALTSADRAAARPWTLQTVAYPRGGFAELARGSPLPRAEQQLRLLNGVYSGGAEPKAGEPVKVVR